MIIFVYQTVTETDGTISAYVHFKSDDGKKIKDCCFQGKSQEDFESKIENKTMEIETEISKKQADASMVTAAIDKLIKDKL